MQGIVAGELFAASGKVVKSAGWKDVYENTDDTEEDEDTADDAQKLKDQKLPQMKKGERLHIENVSMNTGRTKPPARFTEATLLAAMENPVRYMESHDTKAAKTLGETGGLGTVATRADIIEKLFNSFLMEKKGNEIHLTSKEYGILRLLLLHQGKVMTHRQLLREIWGPQHEEDTHYLRVHIAHLRQKLGDSDPENRIIRAESGLGYRIVADGAE